MLTGSAGPKELWELVWEHGAHVLVSLGLPDAKEKVRGPGVGCVAPGVGQRKGEYVVLFDSPRIGRDLES